MKTKYCALIETKIFLIKGNARKIPNYVVPNVKKLKILSTKVAINGLQPVYNKDL